MLRLLGQIRPERLYAKQKSIWEGKVPRGKTKFKRIVSMERLPEQDLIDLQTSTATFIAEGLVSHNSATPALDQFGVDGFIYAGSSPWQMTGRYFEMWEEALATEPDGSPSYPEKFMVQLTSWDPYRDWERADQIITRPPLRTMVYIEQDISAFATERVPVEVEAPAQHFAHKNSAIQVYDDNLRQLEKSNPDTFAVERRCLDPHTRVLTADLCWTPIGKLTPGDRLVAVEEFGQVNEQTGKRKERRIVPTTVEAVATTIDEAYRLDFDDGTSVVCSGRHRWLSASKGSPCDYRWRSIEPQGTMGPRSVMKVGDKIRALLQNGNPDMWVGRAMGHERGYRMVKTITAITPMPEQTLVDIQTTTGTFIAEGLISHNSRWAAILDGYLDEKMVDAIFEPWQGEALRGQASGLLSVDYMAHGDPGLVNDLFGYSVAHSEVQTEMRTVVVQGEARPVEMPVKHVVFDVIHAWNPADFEDHRIDYTVPEQEICDYIEAFMPIEQTFDQFNSASSISHIRKHVAAANLPKRTMVYEVTATEATNWVKAEVFKAAINQGRVHAPMLDVHGKPNEHAARAQLELRFLQRKGKRVDHPSSGPVQSKDIADAMIECVWKHIGKEVAHEMGYELAALKIGGGQQGGSNPYGAMTDHEAGKNNVADIAAQFGRSTGGAPSMGQATSASRGYPGRRR